MVTINILNVPQAHPAKVFLPSDPVRSCTVPSVTLLISCSAHSVSLCAVWFVPKHCWITKMPPHAKTAPRIILLHVSKVSQSHCHPPHPPLCPCCLFECLLLQIANELVSPVYKPISRLWGFTVNSFSVWMCPVNSLSFKVKPFFLF